MKEIVLVCCMVMGLCMGTAQAHDPSLYSSVIVKTDQDWRLKMTFGSGGLLTAMQTYFNDENIEISETAAFREKMYEYLHAHIQIKVNKHFDIELTDLHSVITAHATEINFSLNIPPQPKYWDIIISACKENSRATNMLRVIIDEESDLFKLSKKENLSIVLASGKDGRLKQVQQAQ